MPKRRPSSCTSSASNFRKIGYHDRITPRGCRVVFRFTVCFPLLVSHSVNFPLYRFDGASCGKTCVSSFSIRIGSVIVSSVRLSADGIHTDQTRVSNSSLTGSRANCRTVCLVPAIYFVATHTTQALETHGDSVLKNLLTMPPTRFNSNAAPSRLCRKGISEHSPMDFQGIS